MMAVSRDDPSGVGLLVEVQDIVNNSVNIKIMYFSFFIVNFVVLRDIGW